MLPDPLTQHQRDRSGPCLRSGPWERLGPALAPVVEAGGADVGVAEPVLDAGDVGFVVEGVGGGGGPEGVDDAFHGNAGQGGVLPDELVDAVARERPAGPAGLRRLEQGCVPVAAVLGELEVVAQGRERGRVDRYGPGLGALAADPEVRHAPVLVERADGEARNLIAAESVVEQDGEECPVAPRLEAAPLRSAEQPACLGIGERRRPAFGRVLHPGPLHARDGVLVDGVLVAEVAEERGDGREFSGTGSPGRDRAPRAFSARR